MDHASARATVVDGMAIAKAPASEIVAPRVTGLHHWEPGGWRLADHRANPITAFRTGRNGERRRDGLDTDRGSYESFGPPADLCGAARDATLKRRGYTEAAVGSTVTGNAGSAVDHVC